MTIARGARRVYAAARRPFAHADARVTLLTFDLTDSAQIQAAFERVESLDILVNVVPGPVDTEMSRGLEIPKASPESVARAIFDGVDHGDEEIFPDPVSASLAQSWNNGALKAMERQNAAMATADPVAS